MKSRKKKLLEIGLLIISICYLLLYCHPLIISSDEAFTLSLVHHSFGKVIYLDSLDVHPPLYYLLLKIFINRLTFWTDNVMIKVLSARLFSIVATIITFGYLVKFTQKLGIHVDKILLWCLFLALPNVLGIRFLFQQMTNVRMYALAAMFVTMALYYAFKFNDEESSLMNWSLMTISAIAAAYTHYYAAMFVGLLILINLFRAIRKPVNKRVIKGFAGTLAILILTYLPWLPVFYRQLTSTHTYWMTDGIMLRDLVIYVILFGIFAYPLYKYTHQREHWLFNQQLTDVVISLTIVFILTLGISVFSHPIFLSRYFYPLLVIYEFMGICATLELTRKTPGLKINTFVIMAMLLLNVCGSAAYQIHTVDHQNLQTIRTERKATCQDSPVQLTSANNQQLLQNYVYILYQGHGRLFNLKSHQIHDPILKVHPQTYADITKFIER